MRKVTSDIMAGLPLLILLGIFGAAGAVWVLFVLAHPWIMLSVLGLMLAVAWGFGRMVNDADKRPWTAPPFPGTNPT
jgi:hypothetical protein